MNPFQGTVHLDSGLHFSILLCNQIPTSLLGFGHPLCSACLAARCSGKEIKNEGFLGWNT